MQIATSTGHTKTAAGTQDNGCTVQDNDHNTINVFQGPKGGLEKMFYLKA